jgi:hypothetical protein
MSNKGGTAAANPDEAGGGKGRILIVAGAVALIGAVAFFFVGRSAKPVVERQPTVREMREDVRLWLSNINEDRLQTDIQNWIAPGGRHEEHGGE